MYAIPLISTRRSNYSTVAKTRERPFFLPLSLGGESSVIRFGKWLKPRARARLAKKYTGRDRSAASVLLRNNEKRSAKESKRREMRKERTLERAKEKRAARGRARWRDNWGWSRGCDRILTRGRLLFLSSSSSSSSSSSYTFARRTKRKSSTQGGSLSLSVLGIFGPAVLSKFIIPS